MFNLFQNKPKIFDISSVNYKKPIDEQLVNKLVNYLTNLKAHKIMVGVSGEISSLLVCLLLKKALKEQVVVMIVDINNNLTQEMIELYKQLNFETYILDRRDAYQNSILNYPRHTLPGIRNFFQRFVNYQLLTQADVMKAILIDTADKSDRLLGTKPAGFYGHFMPFYALYKSELLDLAPVLNIPGQFISSGSYQDLLYPENIALPWDKIDPVLFLLTEKQLSPEEISQQCNIDLSWLKRLKQHVDKQLFQTPLSQFII